MKKLMHLSKSQDSLTKMLNLCKYLTLSCTVLLCSSLGNLCAEEKLPDGEEILKRHIKATGGKEAYEKIQNRVIKETMEIPSKSFKATMITWQARPNKKRILLEQEAAGNMEKGTNGDVAWWIIINRGSRLIEGQEKVEYLREASFDRFINWQDNYLKAECTGSEDVDGTVCFKVVMTLASGDSQIYYFAKDSYLIIKTETTINNTPVVTYFSDYKDVDGILISHNRKESLMGIERTITTNSIEHNVEFQEDPFKVPDEIQALIKEN